MNKNQQSVDESLDDVTTVQKFLETMKMMKQAVPCRQILWHFHSNPLYVWSLIQKFRAHRPHCREKKASACRVDGVNYMNNETWDGISKR